MNSFHPLARRASFFMIGALLVLGPTSHVGAQVNPDNTKVNQRDHQASQATADQQPNNRSDLEITRQIRKAIVADKSLSTYAHNIKIITKGSKVTLKGPVRSDAEKKTLEVKATEIAGAGNVTARFPSRTPPRPLTANLKQQKRQVSNTTLLDSVIYSGTFS